MNKPNRPYIPKDYDVKTSQAAEELKVCIIAGKGEISPMALSSAGAKIETFGTIEKEIMKAIYAGGRCGINYDDYDSTYTLVSVVNECIKFLIGEGIIVADVPGCKELALSLPAYFIVGATKVKVPGVVVPHYIPENYSYMGSTAVLLDGMDLDKNNPVIGPLMMAAGNKYLALGEVAKVLLMHLYRGFHNRLTYETLFDKAKRQIKGPGPADAFFTDKIAASTQQLFTEDLIYLSKDEGDELVLSPILRLVFDSDPAMRGSAQIDITTSAKADDAPKPFMKIGVCDLNAEQAATIFVELLKEMRYQLDSQAGVYKLVSNALPGMSFDSKACVAFMQEYAPMLEVKETPTGTGNLSIKLNTITDKVSDAEAINLPDSCMFFGAVLKGFEVPPGELKKIYDQLMVPGNFKVEFDGISLDITIEESLEFMKAYRAVHQYVEYAEQRPSNKPGNIFPMMRLELIGNTIEGTANVPDNSMFVGATLAGRVVPPSELRSVYQQAMSNHHIGTLFASGGIAPPNSKMDLNFGGAVWSVRIGEVYMFVVCYRQLMDILGIGAKAPVLYLGNMVVSERESVQYYEEIKKETFSTESLSANYRYKPTFGALAGCLFTFEQIRQYKRDYDSMSTLIGRTVEEEGIVLGNCVIRPSEYRSVYDSLLENHHVRNYNKEGLAYKDTLLTIPTRGKDVKCTAKEGSEFIAAFKKLKKQLKKQ